MLLSLLSAAPVIGLVLAVAAAGGVGRDCLLLASNTVLAPRLFLVRMDRGAPWHSLTAADNALTAGALTGAAGVAVARVLTFSCKSIRVGLLDSRIAFNLAISSADPSATTRNPSVLTACSYLIALSFGMPMLMGVP